MKKNFENHFYLSKPRHAGVNLKIPQTVFKRPGLAFFFWIFMAASAFAQQYRVTGKVMDVNGIGLPGINVVIKGTAIGTATDAEGNFTLAPRTPPYPPGPRHDTTKPPTQQHKPTT